MSPKLAHSVVSLPCNNTSAIGACGPCKPSIRQSCGFTAELGDMKHFRGPGDTMLRCMALTGVLAWLVALGTAAAQAERAREIVSYNDVRIDVIVEGRGPTVVL